MKFILLVIGIILLVLVFRGSSEKFDVNEAIFNEVEIPTDSDLAKDPYYQKIKNRDFPCMCGETKEMNALNQCVPGCPLGQRRHTNGICYPPCSATEETRDANGICRCPINKTKINNDISDIDLIEFILKKFNYLDLCLDKKLYTNIKDEIKEIIRSTNI